MSSGSAVGSGHDYPDITDYEKPFIGYQSFPSATSLMRKGLKSEGSTKKSGVSIDIERVTIGLKRERYDNKFAYVALVLGESKGGEDSLASVGDFEAELNHEAGLIYGSGIHLSKKLDWSLYMSISSAKMTVDNESKEGTGFGLGTEFLIGFSRYLDVGLNVQYSRHYYGGGLSANINF
jgi:hypothetical protein